MAALSWYVAYFDIFVTLPKESDIIAIKRLSITIMLNIVHNRNNMITSEGATVPKPLLSKSPNIIL
jgi:hypothetical protein